MAGDSDKPRVIALVGPTASGKTALSLALAEQLNGEIVACDSRTVYRHFDIGTAKPSPAEQTRIKHHLLDVVEPDEHYTVAEYVTQAAESIRDITARQKLPIICGGTGFYARALLEGLIMPDVQPQEQLRADLELFGDTEGNQALHEKLRLVDPKTALRLNVNDRFRIIRALEVYTVTGRPMSDVVGRADPPYRTLWLGLNTAERTNLHQRIRLRFVQQVDEGLVDETTRLYERYGTQSKLMHTVNYKQIVQYLEGEHDLERALELATQHNVQLARRQIIWFRSNPLIRWFEIDQLNSETLRRSVFNHINEWLSA